MIERELDGFVNAARALWELRDDFWFQETEIRDWGDNVLWLGHADAKRSTGQVVLDQEFAVYFTIKAGTISRMPSYLSYSQAFRAAGLSGWARLEAAGPRLLGPRCQRPTVRASGANLRLIGGPSEASVNGLEGRRRA